MTQRRPPPPRRHGLVRKGERGRAGGLGLCAAAALLLLLLNLPGLLLVNGEAACAAAADARSEANGSPPSSASPHGAVVSDAAAAGDADADVEASCRGPAATPTVATDEADLRSSTATTAAGAPASTTTTTTAGDGRDSKEQGIGSCQPPGGFGGSTRSSGSEGSTPATASSDSDSDSLPDSSSSESSTSSSSSSTPFQCGIYMAPSTIPGAGLGVFTGVARREGDVVGSGDVIVPVVDVHYHLQNYQGYNTQNDNVRATVEVTVDYVWNGVEMGMARETAFGAWNDEGVTAYCPGLDAAINCHLALVNVDKSHPMHDALDLHRSRDPGAGAFSPYHNCTTVATAAIPAGAELFKYYGENWFLTRSHAFPNVPLNENYDSADRLIADMDDLLDSLDLFRGKKPPPSVPTGDTEDSIDDDDNGKAEAAAATDATSATSSSSSSTTTIDRDLYGILASSPYRSRSRTLNALPDPQHLDAARASGVRSTNQRGATKSVAELHQRGLCVDTIRPGRSTVRQAGRGAFAQTSFRAGQVVTGTPLLVCDSVEFMTLYDGDWWERATPPTKRKVGDQLVLNYCHRHPSSPSLFLCPYGYLVNYINHAPTHAEAEANSTTTTTSQQDQSYSANVRLEWAEDGALGHNATLLTLSPHHIVRASPGLFWHYVATRDIREGDEIFLDYGELWQQKWDEHVRDFEREHRYSYDSSYASAREYNARHANEALRTAKEQARHPYPGHLELRCLNELGANGTKVASRMSGRAALELWTMDNVGSRCVVTGRDWQHDRYLYRIELEYHVWDSDASTYVYDSTRVVKRVERPALRFFDVPYSTDLFLPTAFRHPLGIPDAMFPAAWRNYHGYHHNEDDEGDDGEAGPGRTSAPSDPGGEKGGAAKAMPGTAAVVSGISVP